MAHVLPLNTADSKDVSHPNHTDSNSKTVDIAVRSIELDSHIEAKEPKGLENRRKGPSVEPGSRKRLRVKPASHPFDRRFVFGTLSLKQLRWHAFLDEGPTKEPNLTAKSPPEEIRGHFAEFLILWMTKLQYPAIPSQRIFLRRENWILSGRWGNDVSEGSHVPDDPADKTVAFEQPRRWPERLSYVSNALVVKDRKDQFAPDWDSAVFFYVWIRRYIQTKYGMEGFLPMGGVFCTFAYIIRYEEDRSRDPKRGSNLWTRDDLGLVWLD